jgi:spermidine synthase
MGWIDIDAAETPEGGRMVLRHADGIWEIRVNGWELMSNRAHRSEEALAELGCARLAGTPRILIGGLGMGYTLRAALDHLPQAAHVVMAELLPAIIAWNRGPLALLAGRPLSDPRVEVRRDDVGNLIAEAEGLYDAILLDVDNGPHALTDQGNHRLYGATGLARARRALRPGGILAVWSADPAPDFERALNEAGFTQRSVAVSPRGTPDGPLHSILLGTLPKVAEYP